MAAQRFTVKVSKGHIIIGMSDEYGGEAYIISKSQALKLVSMLAEAVKAEEFEGTVSEDK